MKKITDSFVFNQLIKNPKVKTSIQSISIEKDAIPKIAIEDQIKIIDKKMKFAGKDKIINGYLQGSIIPIYNPTNALPKYLNTVLKSHNGTVVAIADLTNNSRINAEGISDIYAKTLFALLQNALINHELYLNWNKYATNITITKNASMLYSKLMGKVLDKLYAIKVDAFKSDLVHFMLAKFFIINMCDRLNTDTTNRIAHISAFNNSSYELLIEEEGQFEDEIYNDLNSFLKALSTLSMPSLNIRIFLENHARMYGESTILGMDYLPAFLGNIFSTAINGNLAKDYIIDSVCGKQLSALYLEFFKLVG